MKAEIFLAMIIAAIVVFADTSSVSADALVILFNIVFVVFLYRLFSK